ncbi:MAG TPA: hypothetical protein VJ885_16685 [Thermoanaerobaculia bacterium]|nr:hypothetical protein [Thermoanaerobaculia bacterium]
MTSHDQLAKSLIGTFFAEFLRLTAPDSAPLLRMAEATFVDKESFTDWPVGDRREMDLLVKVPPLEGELPLLVHVEIETEARPGMDRRLWHYYMQLRLRHGLLVLPILVNLRGGRPGLFRQSLREVFGSSATAVFRYRALGLSGCRAEDWLARSEPVAWAFAALMRPGRWSRAELKLECLRRIAESDEVAGLRKLILVDWVETYVQLSERDAAEFQRLLDLEGHEEIKSMELTWLGKAEARGMEQGLAQGMAQGAEAAKKEAVDRMRRVVLRLMSQRFGKVPAGSKRAVGAIDSIETLATLAEKVLVVQSLDDMGLR